MPFLGYGRESRWRLQPPLLPSRQFSDVSVSRAQTYDPRRWETDSERGEVQQFRHRAYDPKSARWLHEDPIGLAGSGVNMTTSPAAKKLGFSPAVRGVIDGVDGRLTGAGVVVAGFIACYNGTIIIQCAIGTVK